MKIFLLRHGRTEFNEKDIMQGLVNSDLTEKGKFQAERVALFLKEHDIDVIYSSDLGRCKETIAPFLKLRSEIPIFYDEGLRERNTGVFDGGPVEVWVNFLKENGFIGDLGFRPENGESLVDARERITEKINEIVSKEFGKNVLIVSHGSALASFLLGQFEKEFSSKFYGKYKLDNTGVSILEFDKENGFSLVDHNLVGHLKLKGNEEE